MNRRLSLPRPAPGARSYALKCAIAPRFRVRGAHMRYLSAREVETFVNHVEDCITAKEMARHMDGPKV